LLGAACHIALFGHGSVALAETLALDDFAAARCLAVAALVLDDACTSGV